MNLENEKKEFEDWAEKETNWDLYWSENINQYMDHQTNSAWLAWLASANRVGYKLVPVEASDHMKCVVRDFGPDIEDYENMGKHKWEVLCGDIYKAMIGACDD